MATRNGNGKVKPADLVLRAREQLTQLTGREAEAVLGIERSEDGWTLTVEVLELQRVPATTDLLGCYEVQLDDDGELVGYGRRGRYERGTPDQRTEG